MNLFVPSRRFKTFLKNLCCEPHKITNLSCGVQWTYKELVHASTIAIQAKRQACLARVLHMIAEHSF